LKPLRNGTRRWFPTGGLLAWYYTAWASRNTTYTADRWNQYIITRLPPPKFLARLLVYLVELHDFCDTAQETIREQNGVYR
jgi:hypothetical protein